MTMAHIERCGAVVDEVRWCEPGLWISALGNRMVDLFVVGDTRSNMVLLGIC